MTSYKTYLRSIGRKPLPSYFKLRTEKRPGDKVIGRTDQPAHEVTA